MTASRTPADRPSLISPVIDYEPAPLGIAACRSAPTLRKRISRPMRALTRPPEREPPPAAAVAFTDAALRRVLEVIDRRRPVVQLRSMLTPAVVEEVIALTRSSHARAATLRRIRLRMVDGQGDTIEAEVFGTYSRGPRMHAVAARIALIERRWRIVALHLG
jgi:hypothetical protein